MSKSDSSTLGGVCQRKCFQNIPDLLIFVTGKQQFKELDMGIFSFLFGGNEASISSEPSVNVDGTPMCGGVDINGNPYGVTESSTDDICSISDSLSSFDCSSAFDDTFDSGCSSFDDW